MRAVEDLRPISRSYDLVRPLLRGMSEIVLPTSRTPELAPLPRTGSPLTLHTSAALP